MKTHKINITTHKTGLLQQATQVGVQAGLEYLQRSRIAGQPVLVICHTYLEEFPLHINVELPMLLCLWPFSFVLSPQGAVGEEDHL